MRKILVAFFIFILTFSGISTATVDVVPSWSSVKFDAGKLRVEILTTMPGYRITKFKVWVSGREASVPKTEYEQISYPELQKISVTEISRRRGSTEAPEAYLEVPFMEESKDHPNTLVSGGSWLFHFKGGKYVGKELSAVNAQ